MKSSLSGITLALMAALLCLVALMPTALAADTQTIEPKAQVTLEGTLPATAEDFKIRITASDPANPMPGGQTGGTYDLTITGADSGIFPAMSFDSLGIYKYTIAEVPGTNPDCTYDNRTYHLTVSIVNSDTGDGYTSSVALREEGMEEKTNIALFHNIYKTVVTPPGTITPTGVNDLWMYEVGGAAFLLAAAAVIVHFLRQKRNGSHGVG